MNTFAPVITLSVIRKGELVLFSLLFIFTLFFFVNMSYAADTFTFGTTSIGGTTDSGNGNNITCNQYTSPSSGNTTSISVAVGAIDPAKKNYSLALYSDVNNNPTTLLGYNTGSLVANSWNTLTVNAAVSQGMKYWICYNSNTQKTKYNNIKYTAGSAVALYKVFSYGSWPSNFGTVNGRWTDNYSLYITATMNLTPTPTTVPTTIPTATPTPTAVPTTAPTATPTPTAVPTTAPTATPTPTAVPTTIPTATPTPTAVPTTIPTATPTPTTVPTTIPTATPTPTTVPTTIPTATPTPTTFTFGMTTVGASTDTGDGNSITCTQYSTTSTGSVISMSVAVGAIDAASKNYSLALYQDVGNSPTTLLASATGVLTANSWNTLPISASVIAGNKYWMCYNTSTSNSAYNNVKYGSGSTLSIYKDQSYGNWPTTFGTVGGQWTASYSFYATATTSLVPTSTPTPSLPVTPTPTTIPTPTISVTPTVTPTQTSVLSRNVPSYASSGTAANANDADYNTTWRSTSAASWLAYDLSSIPQEERNSLLLVWYNEATDAYDPALANESAIEYPKDYTIQINNAAGGGTAPTSGWTTQTTVSANKYHSRQHVVNFTGANWVRINVTTVNGGSRANLNMDVYNAASALENDWIIYGSSTPSMAMNHTTVGSATQSFSQMINQEHPALFPIQENGSISGLNTEDGVQYINSWLSIFPGKYVGIALGANDADQCMNPTTFYNNYVYMINAVTAAGKVPVIPLFNWSKLSSVQSCGPSLIAEINKLYVDFPQVVPGPDFWTYYKNHPELISSDNTHPTSEGLGIYRQMWAQSVLQNIY